MDLCPSGKKGMAVDYDSEPEFGRNNGGMKAPAKSSPMLRMLFVLIAVNSFVLVGLGGLIVWLAIETHNNRDDIRDAQDDIQGINKDIKTLKNIVEGNQVDVGFLKDIIDNQGVVLVNQPRKVEGFSNVSPLFEGSGYWAERKKMPMERSDHQVALVDDRVYIIGGLDTEENVTDDVTIYDTVLDTYEDGPRLPVPLHRFAIGSIPGEDGMKDGKIYITGGLRSANFEEKASDETYILDVKSGKWTKGPKLNIARSDFCGAAVDGKFYVAGGWTVGFEKTLDSVEVLDPAEDAWKQLKPSLPTARGDCKCGILQDTFVVVGGFFDPLDQWRATQFRKEVEGYNTTSKKWVEFAPLPDPRGDIALATLPGDRLLAIGGETHSRGERPEVATHEVNEYIGQHDSWVRKVPLPQSRFRMDAVWVDDVVYVFGGHSICIEGECPETDVVQAFFDIDHPDVFLAARS